MSPRRAAALCALLATTATCGLTAAPAQAQDATPPPVNHNVDANGVDVVLGQFNFSQELLSIGPADRHGLRYVRSFAGQGWLENFQGGLFQNGTEFLISAGNTSTKFTSSKLNLYQNPVFTPARADGSSLTLSGSVFTYINKEGTVARFTAEINNLGHIVDNTARIIDVRYPDGTLVTLNYLTQSVCVTDEFGQQSCTNDFRVQSITDNLGYVLRYNYAANSLTADSQGDWHRLVSVRAVNAAIENYCDPIAVSCTEANAWPTASFAQNGGTETVTLPDSSAWTFTTNGSAWVIRRPGSTVDDISVVYDSLGRVQSVTNANGTWNYSFSDNGNVRTTTVQGPLGTGFTAVSDLTKTVVTSITDSLNHTTTFDYYDDGRPKRTTAPEQNYVELIYDSRGNVTETHNVAKPNSGAAEIVTYASYPQTCTSRVMCNRPATTTDARGNVTDYSYDPTHGGLTSMTQPAPTANAVRPKLTVTYTPLQAYYRNSSGGIAASGSPIYLPTSTSTCQTASSCTGTQDEVLTSNTYGPQSAGTPNNLLPDSASSGDGAHILTATQTLAYDNIGNLLTVDGPLAGTADKTRFRYDGARRVVGAVTPDPDGSGPLKPRAKRLTLNPDGQPSKVEIGTVNTASDSDWSSFAPLVRKETGYDAYGRVVTESQASGTTSYTLTQTNYDAAGRVSCVAQRMNPAVFATVTSTTDACALGPQGSQGADFGPDRIAKTQYATDGSVTSVTSALGTADAATQSATYTPNGQPETVTDGESHRTTYVYDGHDRFYQRLYPSPTQLNTSNASDYEQLGYDVNGNVTSRRRRDGTSIGYGFDNLDRLMSKDLPAAETDATYAYDNLGRLTGITQGSATLGFGYDALGRNTGQTDVHGTITSTYDLAGRRIQVDYPGLSIAQDYLVTGETNQIRQLGTNPATLATFGYDPNTAAGQLGLRTSLTLGDGSVATYGYDPVQHLTQLAHAPVTGPAVTFGQGFNPDNQITGRTVSNNAFAWGTHFNAARTETPNGLNQLDKVNGVSTSYDARGNLLNDTQHAYTYSSENLLKTASGGVTLGYDPALRLSSIQSGGVTTTFGYDGDDVVAEYDGSGNVLRRYVQGPEGDEPLVWYEGSGTADRRYLHADERGSVVAVTDGAGKTLGINRYDEYGAAAPQNIGRFQYTGQKWLPAAGLYDYKARMYDPVSGRFLQPDPIGYESGLNLYAYADGDPVNETDPLGLKSKDDDAIVVNGPHRVADTGSGLGGIGGGGRTFSGSGNAIAGPSSPRNPAVCGDAACSWVIVNAPPKNKPWYFNGRAYVLNNRYQKSRWSKTVDIGTGILFGGPAAFIFGWEALAPMVPEALTAAEEGQIIGWGGGPTALADATARAAQITPQVVADMRARGLTLRMLAYWRNRYSWAIANGRGGAIAPARLILIETILRNW
jgi:RHS repeat-associated protein